MLLVTYGKYPHYSFFPNLVENTIVSDPQFPWCQGIGAKLPAPFGGHVCIDFQERRDCVEDNPLLAGCVNVQVAVSAPSELYPVPQNAPHVSAGMNPVPTPPSENDAFPTQHGWNGVNVLELPKGQRPKATYVSPWYGVYFGHAVEHCRCFLGDSLYHSG